MNRLLRALPSAFLCVCAFAQNAGPVDTTPSFRTRVDLVLVPVVVRDRNGSAVGGLTKDDFQLLDRGKPQVISQFSVEESTSQAQSAAAASHTTPPDARSPDTRSRDTTRPDTTPSRFVAYVFDDVHGTQSDLNDARDAAVKHIGLNLGPADRAAIFTTSGRNMLDFTGDPQKIHDALFALRAHSSQVAQHDCLPMTYSMADQIRNQHDSSLIDALLPQEEICADMPLPQYEEQLRRMIEAAAARVVPVGDSETNSVLRLLDDVVRRLSVTPGERNLILVSPGFLVNDNFRALETDLMQRAIGANVVIGGVGGRGLYNANEDDVSLKIPGNMAGVWSDNQRASAITNDGTLAELAAATGGQFFHNSNDLVEGLNRVAARPRYIYVLGFAPQNPANDGKYHALKVTVRNAAQRSGAYDIQARRGYYAPKGTQNAARQTGFDIRAALYSHNEQSEIPISVATELSNGPGGKMHLVVNTQVDIRGLQYKKAAGVNQNDLSMVSGVFDRDGKLIDSVQRQLNLRLKNDILAKVTASPVASGILFKIEFDLPSGDYQVRLILRDSEGRQLTAHSLPVKVP